jgi:zinc and cadmium transporter
MFEIILASVVVMLASLVGVLSVWKNIGQIIEKNLHFLVSFSAGVFLIITYGLGVEVLEHAESPKVGIIWILVGMIGIWLIFKLLPTFHHHHDHEMTDHVHTRIDVRKIILSDGLHNIGDGILLAASFAVSSTLGYLSLLSIFVHELVQEISEFFVMKEAGYSTKKALGVNFLTSATILVGSIGGFFLLDAFEAVEVPLLGIAAGSFLMVVFQDLIPHSVASASKKHILRHIAWFIIGAVLMYFVGQLAHGH